MRGKFITLYGINNIGKSTHAKRLVKRLEAKGIKAQYIKFPVYDIAPSGPFINQILRPPKNSAATNELIKTISDEELQMWFTINRFQSQATLEEALSKGIWVIAEDYTGTGIAWGAAKGVDLHWLIETNAYLIKEDFSIMLDGNRDLRARESGHIHENDAELASRCQRIHRQLAKKFDWKVVDIQPNFDDTEELIWKLIAEKFF